MRLLVAGATGALGTPLTRELFMAGHEVIGLNRMPTHGDKLPALGAEPLGANAMDRRDEGSAGGEDSRQRKPLQGLR